MLLLGPLFKAGFRGLWVCPWDPEKAESSAFTCTDRKGPGVVVQDLRDDTAEVCVVAERFSSPGSGWTSQN